MTQHNQTCSPYDSTEAPDDHTDQAFGTKPTVLYDGDCGFCKLWILRWKTYIDPEIHFAPFQLGGQKFPQISESEFKKAIHFILSTKETYKAAHAVFKLLTYSKKRWHHALRTLYENIPPFRFFSELSYRFVERHRPFFFKLFSWVL